MALFNDTLIQDIVALVHQRYLALANALGQPPSPTNPDQHSPLYRDLQLLIRVANGELTRSDHQVALVEQALTRVLEVLLGNVLKPSPTFEESFWQTDLGIVVSRARWWVSVDDLITISNAAALAFGENNQANRMRIARAINNGLLEWVPDPSIVNPMHNRRVLRSQVEHLRDLRRLPVIPDLSKGDPL